MKSNPITINALPQMETELSPANTADDLEAVKRQRDGLAVVLEKYGTHLPTCAHVTRRLGAGALCFTENCDCGFDDVDQSDVLAAHDRAVAARVLRDACRFLRWDSGIIMLKQLAAQYERGEREVPSE